MQQPHPVPTIAMATKRGSVHEEEADRVKRAKLDSIPPPPVTDDEVLKKHEQQQQQQQVQQQQHHHQQQQQQQLHHQQPQEEVPEHVVVVDHQVQQQQQVQQQLQQQHQQQQHQQQQDHQQQQQHQHQQQQQQQQQQEQQQPCPPEVDDDELNDKDSSAEDEDNSNQDDKDKKRTMQWTDECDMLLTENMARDKMLKGTYAFGSGHNTKGQRLALTSKELVKESPEFKALDGPNGGIQINTRLRILYKQWCNQTLVGAGVKGKKARTCWHVPRRSSDVTARHTRVGAQFDEMMDAFADYLDQKDQKKKDNGKRYLSKRRPSHLKWNGVNSLLSAGNHTPAQISSLPSSGLPSVQSTPTYIPSSSLNGSLPLGSANRMAISSATLPFTLTPSVGGQSIANSPMNTNISTPAGLDMAKRRAELELVSIKIQREREELKAQQAKREDKKKLLKKLISDLSDQVELGIFSETEKNERLKAAADKLNEV